MLFAGGAFGEDDAWSTSVGGSDGGGGVCVLADGWAEGLPQAVPGEFGDRGVARTNSAMENARSCSSPDNPGLFREMSMACGRPRRLRSGGPAAAAGGCDGPDACEEAEEEDDEDEPAVASVAADWVAVPPPPPLRVWGAMFGVRECGCGRVREW